MSVRKERCIRSGEKVLQFIQTVHSLLPSFWTNNEKQEEVKKMKEGIHPEYYQATVTCNCGNTFVTGSTKKDIHVEICSKCHPFYTGQQKATAARGRIEKFNRKYGMK